jgi:hypothetical protein
VKVGQWRVETVADRHRVSATVTWEDCDRESREVFFETTAEFAGAMNCDPHAFLLVSILRGMNHGERRIVIDGEICPVLKCGLLTAMTTLKNWYGPDEPIMTIEARVRNSPVAPRPDRAASMLSGGIDSLVTLRANRMNFPGDHPWSIRDGLVIYGFDLGHQFEHYAERYTANFTRQYPVFDRRLAGLREVADDCGLNLIPVYTNTQSLCGDLTALSTQYHGADLAAIAHVFSRRLTICSIGSSATVPNLCPWGSHPLLDPNYGSAELRVLHADLEFTRLEKTELIADWDVALQNLRVCNGWKEDPQSSLLNCGRCEKCLRTMTGLVALGKLEHTLAFAANDVTYDMLVDGVVNPIEIVDWYELIEPLKARGRGDLVRAIATVMRRSLGSDSPATVKKIRAVAGRWRRRLFDRARAVRLPEPLVR